MPAESDLIYRSRDEVVSGLITAMQARIPDIWVGEDGIFRLLCEVLAGEIEGIYLANQLLHDNMFIQTANLPELQLYAEMFGLDVKAGTVASGELLFTGGGATLIEAGTEVASDPGAGDILYFVTTVDGAIPNPGIPTAPTAVDSGTAGNLVAGTYEYVVTFVTNEGETAPGPESNAVILSLSHQINLTAIPLGGAGTISRKVYRSKNGGNFALVTTIADNVTVIYTDNILDVNLGGQPLLVSSAERVTILAESEEPGLAYNIVIGAINQLADVPDGVTAVTNEAVFSGGTDAEDTESLRSRLLDRIRNPQTGSVTDIKEWAEEVDGVETATVFENDNLGTPTNGHVTVRISGPNGMIPDAGVQTAVLDALELQDIANIIFHVGTFTQVPTNVTVDITTESGFVLADTTSDVQAAIINYINSVEVGSTVYVAGIVDAIFGLTGVANVTVSVPATDQTAAATEKRTPGAISVT